MNAITDDQMLYNERDVRAMEALCRWRILGEKSTRPVRLSAKDTALLRRGIALERSGVRLVVADDPDGQYDSPRLLDIDCAIATRDEWIALRRPPQPEVQP